MRWGVRCVVVTGSERYTPAGGAPQSPSHPLARSIIATPDILVIGSGPAGLSIAAALGERGLPTAVLAPRLDAPWPAEYGAWQYELAELGLSHLIGHQWPRTRIETGEAGTKVLGFAYTRVAKQRLRQELLRRCEAAGVEWFAGAALAAQHDAGSTRIALGGGASVTATLVIDATGHRPALVRVPPQPRPAFQTAYGLTVDAPAGALDPGEALLMDWRQPAGGQGQLPPSFLYAFPLADGRIFAEETVLAARPAVAPARLRPRLIQRLRERGITLPESAYTDAEQVWIPMGGAIPPPQRVIGFGGAAAMVNPATGYMLTQVLAMTPLLADAISAGFRDGLSPAAVSVAAWEALWPPDKRRAYALQRFGTELLLRLDERGTQRFFTAFFELEPHLWQGYLSGRMPATQVAAVMRKLFLRLPWSIRAEILRTAWGTEGVRLIEAAAGLQRP